ncbi:hypothetical protein Tco_1046589 [Tanacetum coccineum]
MGYEKLSQKLTFYKAFFSPQWKFLIHTILQCLSAKTTAWNEFSSTMASAIICLATNQKFNFSKYIFESMVKNLDNVGKFLMYPRKQRPKKTKSKDTQIPQSSSPTDNVADEAVNKEMNDSLERAATTATSLDAEQDMGNINKTQPKERPNEPSSPGTSLGGGPRGNTLRSGEDSLKLHELMELCTNLQQRVLDLENIKTAQAQEITSLKLRVKKLEKKGGSRTYRLKRLYKVGRSRRIESFEEESLGNQEDASKQGRIDDIDADKDIYLVNVHRDEDMFGVNDLEGNEVVIESEVADKDVNLSVDEVTLSQALTALKSAKVQEKGDVIKVPSVPVSAASTKVSTVIPTTAATKITAVSSRPIAKGIVKDKGKGKMVEEEPIKKMSKKELLKLDEELAFKLQAEEDEEKRLAREKAQKVEEANLAWDDIQAKVEADYQLAQILQAQEQEELSDAEKATLFVDDDKETEELKQCREIIPADEDDVTIEVTPLSTKSLTIIDYKIYKEGKKSYFQIIRASSNSQMYLTFQKMLKNFDNEDLEVLWSIVKERFKKIEPVNYMDTFLYLNLKTMFEHHLEDNVWKNQQGLVKVLNWKLYDSCGVYCVTMQNILYYLLVEKMYPLTKHTLHQMFNDAKLQVDYECEMAFELLRLINIKFKGRLLGLKAFLKLLLLRRADPTLQVPLDEIQVNAKLNFVEEPVEILEREFKKLKRSRIAIVKVRWNSKRGPEFTWEREDQMKLKYPHLFSDVSS